MSAKPSRQQRPGPDPEIEHWLKSQPEPIIDDENPEWTEEDFARAKGPESLPPEVLAAFPKTAARLRGPQKAPTKRLVSLRLDLEIVEHFKAGGRGWQSRINAALLDAIHRKRV